MFNTLTEFFAWLSVNHTQGTTYRNLAHEASAAPQGSQQQQQKIQVLESWLGQYLPPAKIAVITGAITNGHTAAIRNAVGQEHVGPISASFANVSLLW